MRQKLPVKRTSMTTPTLHVGFPFALVLIAASTTVTNAPAGDKLSAKLTVEVDRVVLANAPLQLQITITNTGDTPIGYWCGGPELYPSARPFSVFVKDEQGRTRS